MKNYRCWTPANVRHVMNPDAEHLEDAVFLAVHSDHELVLVDTTAQHSGRTWDERKRWTIPAPDFVTEFLSSTRHQVQVAVLGQSGSGKSHFIHWLKLHIPSRADQVVLTIPKTRTSLRGILQQLMRELPPDQSIPYQTRLSMVGDTLSTPDERKDRLLSEIALALPHAELPVLGDDDSDAIGYLREALPHLFHDPHMRTLWKRPDGIVEHLAAHIVSSPQNYHRVDERRQFTLADLPLNAREMVQMSTAAKDVISNLLDDEPLSVLAVRLINASLNDAIMHVLHFSGQQLIDLMLDVRRFLLQQEQGLILLIEDFAILQGIDVALLQALNESSGTGADALCDLRWAMAVTRGYYDGLPDTVKTRMDFVIDMDLPTSGSLSIMPDTKLVDFGARYLNAARLEPASLNNWSRRSASMDSETVPNPCTDCTFRTECHASFGATEHGVGFYPFNQHALVAMAKRQDALADDRFNPRRFIKMVLANVLATYSDELNGGIFPSKRFLDEMHGTYMPPQLAHRIHTQHPRDIAERLIAVEQLWGSEAHLDQLPDGLYEAFDLPIPAFGTANLTITSSTAPHSSTDTVPTVVVAPIGQDKILMALHQWANGNILPETEADILRDYVYEAICGFIDWDAEGLARTRLTARTNLFFRKRYIRFVHQQTQPTPSSVSLCIPMTDDDTSMRHAAIALEGLYHFAQTGEWTFENGLQSLMTLNTCLADWSQQLLPQLRRVFQSTDTQWEPVTIATEVLVTCAVLTGKITTYDIHPAEALNALFAIGNTALPSLPSAWSVLVDAILEKRTNVEKLLLTWATSTKGGRTGKLLTPHLIMPHLVRFLKNPNYTNLPKDIASSGDYAELMRLHEKLRADLPKLLESEFTYRQQWYQTATATISADVTYTDLVQSVERFNATSSAVGILRSRTLKDKFEESFGNFKKMPVVRLIREHSRLNAANLWAQLPFLARRPGNLEEVTKFFELLSQVIAEAEQVVAEDFARAIKDEGQLKTDMESITQDLGELEQIFLNMEDAL